MRKEARHTQMRDRASGVHPDILEHLPPTKTGVCLLYCFVNPLLRISEGISDYIQRKKGYNVLVENDDELKVLNDNVKELVESNRKLSKRV